MSILDDWVTGVCAELGIGGPIDRDLILDMTRNVAHGVARPAAPLTAYLVGLAAGPGPDHAARTAEAIGRVSALVLTWPMGDP